MNKTFTLCASVLALSLLGACSTSNPDVIQRHDAQRMSQVVDAKIGRAHV